MNFPPPADYIAALFAALPKRLAGRVAAEPAPEWPEVQVRVTFDGAFAYRVNTAGVIVETSASFAGGTSLFNLVRRVGRTLEKCTCDKCGAYAYVRAAKTDRGPWLCAACVRVTP